MITSDKIDMVCKKYFLLMPNLNECTRRQWAATEALALGHGGITAVHKATGIALSTICIGLNELKDTSYVLGNTIPGHKRVRKKGGGRKKISDYNPELISALDSLVEPHTRGDPMSPLRWTCKSTRNLANELLQQKYRVSHSTVANILHEQKYSLKSNRKTDEGKSHPDRNA
ncbi:MAG: ISAzo13 family transposase, partial [archaeon]